MIPVPMPGESDKGLATLCIHLPSVVSPYSCYESLPYQRLFAKVRVWRHRSLTSLLSERLSLLVHFCIYCIRYSSNNENGHEGNAGKGQFVMYVITC